MIIIIRLEVREGYEYNISDGAVITCSQSHFRMPSVAVQSLSNGSILKLPLYF